MGGWFRARMCWRRCCIRSRLWGSWGWSGRGVGGAGGGGGWGAAGGGVWRGWGDCGACDGGSERAGDGGLPGETDRVSGERAAAEFAGDDAAGRGAAVVWVVWV